MLKRIATSLLVVAVFVAASRGDEQTKDAKLTEADREFIEKALTCTNMEVKLSETAARSATRDDVKEFAKVMIEDHTKASKQLLDILNKKSVTAPDVTASKSLKEATERLSSAKGADWDTTYIEQMVKNHEAAVQLFEKYSKEGTNEDLKQYAATVLPTVKDHLERARKLQKGDK